MRINWPKSVSLQKFLLRIQLYTATPYLIFFFLKLSLVVFLEIGIGGRQINISNITGNHIYGLLFV